MSNNARKGTRAVLLAAGQGKRMKSSKPKVLHEVLGKTILGRVLDAVDALEIDHVHVVVGHEAEQVRAFLLANPPKTPLSIHLQEPQQGTGHALMQVAPDLKNFSGTLLVSVADTPLLQGRTLASLVDGHLAEKAAVTLLTTVVQDAKSYGRILRDDQGSVTGIIEDKDATEAQKQIREINPAIYCFEWPTVRDGLFGLKNENKQGEYYLTDLVGWAHQNKLRTAGVVTEDWREVAGINSRRELSEAMRLLRDITVNELSDNGVTFIDPQSTWVAPEVSIGQDSVIMPGCVMTGDIQIGANCEIGPHSNLSGRVRIGSHSKVIQSLVADSAVGDSCRIGPFAHLRDGNELGSKIRVGNFVELKKATVGDQTNVSHLSYVGDATLGSGANIGAGTITANYNHATKVKSKTVIGDGASTGSNSVLVAPVEIGAKASVAAGTVVTKNVPEKALAVGRARQENKLGYNDR